MSTANQRAIRPTGDKFYKVARNIGAVARASGAALGVAKLALSMLNVEVKHIDIDFSGTLAAAGTVLWLTPCQEGDSDVERGGGEITGKKLSVNTYYRNSNATTLNEIVREIIFVDTMCDGATPAVTDVLAAATINSFYNLDATPRYTIISDRTYPIENGIVGRGIRKTFNMDHNVHYQGGTLNIADALYGQIFMIVMTNVGADQAGYFISTRFRFIDN